MRRSVRWIFPYGRPFHRDYRSSEIEYFFIWSMSAGALYSDIKAISLPDRFNRVKEIHVRDILSGVAFKIIESMPCAWLIKGWTLIQLALVACSWYHVISTFVTYNDRLNIYSIALSLSSSSNPHLVYGKLVAQLNLNLIYWWLSLQSACLLAREVIITAFSLASQYSERL